MRSASPECQANADLLPPPTHCAVHDAEDADDGEQDGQRSQGRQELGTHTLWQQQRRASRGKRLELGKRHRAVERPQLASQAGKDAERLSLGSDDQCGRREDFRLKTLSLADPERTDGQIQRLTNRQIDEGNLAIRGPRRPGACAELLSQVGGDADDLPLASSNQELLADRIPAGEMAPDDGLHHRIG